MKRTVYLLGMLLLAPSLKCFSATEKTASRVAEQQNAGAPAAISAAPPATTAVTTKKSDSEKDPAAFPLWEFIKDILVELAGTTAALLLVAVGWNNLHILGAVDGNDLLKHLPNVKWRVRRRIARLHLTAALKAESTQPHAALLSFLTAVAHIERSLVDAQKDNVDGEPLRRLLEDPALARLYFLSAWADVLLTGNAEAAVTSAERALRLDPNLIEARIARALARIHRNQPGDLALAEAEFELVLRAGDRKGITYFWVLYGEAELLRFRGEYAKAIAAYTALAPDAERLPAIRTGRGLTHHAMGNWAEAVNDLTWVLERQHNDRCRIYRSDALRLLGRWEDALEDCRQILDQNPEDVQAHYVSGLICAAKAPTLAGPPKSEMLDCAVRWFRAAKEIARSQGRAAALDIYVQLANVLNLSGKLHEAAQLMAEVRISPLSSPRSLGSAEAEGPPGSRLNQAHLQMHVWILSRAKSDLLLAGEHYAAAVTEKNAAAVAYTGQAWVRYWQYFDGAPTLDEALVFATLALEHDGSYGRAHAVRGWIMIAKGRYQEARVAFTAATQAAGADSDTYLGLAEVALALGQYDVAIASFSEVIVTGNLPPNEAYRAYYRRGAAQVGLQQWATARQDYEFAIASAIKATVAPAGLAPIYADLAWACYQLRLDDMMEEAFKRAVDLSPKESYVHSRLAAVKLYSRKYNEAIDHYTRVIDLDPESSDGYVNRGLTNIYRHQLDVAVQDLNRAVEKNPKDSFAWHSRGWARLKQRAWDQTIADCDKAIELIATEPFRFHDRALALWWRKEKTKALADLQKVLEMKLPAIEKVPTFRVREDSVTWGSTIEDWTHAVDKGPKDFFPYLGRAVSQWMAGDLAKAHADLVQANTMKGRSPEVQRVLKQVEAELAAASASQK
jgi:tetratricopeptide (TPR) repeat protein